MSSAPLALLPSGSESRAVLPVKHDPIGIGITSDADDAAARVMAANAFPTPSSLPRGGALRLDRSRESSPIAVDSTERDHGVRNERERSVSSSQGAADGNERDEELQTFAFDDVEMGGQREASPEQEGNVPAPMTTNVFSSNVLIRRPYRARYDDAEPSSESSGLTTLPVNATATLESSAYKRTFEQISPSPPRPFSPLSETERDASHCKSLRHSFDSQRATASSSMRARHLDPGASTTLRRRSPRPSMDGARERHSRDESNTDLAWTSRTESYERFKRRRAYNSHHDADEGPNRAPDSDPVRSIDPSLTTFNAVGASQQSSRRARLSLPSLSLPSRLSPASTSTATLSGTAELSRPNGPFSNFRRATSTSYRLSPPANVGVSSVSTSPTGSSSALPANQVLRPRPARARAEPEREREMDPLVTFWREEREHERQSEQLMRETRAILDEAHETLASAEATIRNSSAQRGNLGEARARSMLSSFPSPPTTRPQSADGQSSRNDLPILPSTRGLPSPAESADLPPVVGVRIGEGWNRARNRSHSQVSSPPHSPSNLFSGSPPLSTSASRAFSFLTSLRSRRPRLSRGSTGVPPPEESPLNTPDPAQQESEREVGWLLPPLIPTPAVEWNEADELVEAERLNQTLIARRRAAESLRNAEREGDDSAEGRSGTAAAPWGAFRNESIRLENRRMRGPTERANAQWRMGQAPTDSSGVTLSASAPSNPASARQMAAGPSNVYRTGDALASWRAGILAGSARDDDVWTEPWNDEPVPVTVSPRMPARWQGGASGRTSERAGSQDGTREGTARDNNWFPRSTLDDLRDRQRASFLRPSSSTTSSTGDRVSIRPFSDSQRPPWRTVHNERAPLDFGDDDESDGLEQQPPWRPPSLPLMLPSGSAGRRMVFPHPAHARGAAGAAVDTAGDGRLPDDDLELPLQSRNYDQGPFARPIDRSGVSPVASRTEQRRSTLADALAHLSSRAETDSSLRRRAPTQVHEGRTTDTTESERMARQASRTERLASLRRDRLDLQALIGRRELDHDADTSGTTNPRGSEALRPRSPTTAPRRRTFSDFLRGFGGGHARFATFFDDDFSAFFGRDSAALDPRNYLDDDDFDSSYDALLRLSERLGDVKPKGVSADKLSALQHFTYSQWPMPARRDSVPGSSDIATTSAVKMDEDLPLLARRGIEKEERCAVCLCDYEDDDECMLGHCGHGFHSTCLSEWLKEHAACPVCRRDHAN